MTRLRLHRNRAAYAASGGRDMGWKVSSSDGWLTTTARETDEGTLVVTVLGTAAVSLVRVGWTLLYPDGVGPSHRLVTPLAPARWGFVAAYDVGDVRSAVAVDVNPAEPVTMGQPDPGEVDAAFEAIQFGSARRAWLAALRNGGLAPRVAHQVAARLRAESATAPVEPC